MASWTRTLMSRAAGPNKLLQATREDARALSSQVGR